MTAEEARNVTNNTSEAEALAPILAVVEEAAKSGFLYADVKNLSLKQVLGLQSRGFQLEVFGNQSRVKWSE